VIEAVGLGKTYEVPVREPGVWGSLRGLVHRRTLEVHAVQAVDLRVHPGERVGFLGPNGAGKTTTLKMLAGLLVPSRGSARVLGRVPSAREPELLRRITLVMGQKQQLRWDLPPTETFLLNQALYDIPRSVYVHTLGRLVDLLELEPLLQRPVRNLSLGERMKCELAAALLHRPDVLFLDEPTIGLDVRMQVVVRRFIEAWNRETGATVLLTSHYMADIEALCDRIIIIDGGVVVWDGPRADLVRRVAPGRQIRVQTAEAVDLAALARAGGFEGADGAYTRTVRPEDLPAALAQALAALPVVDLSVQETPLEDVLRVLFAREGGPA
jgi:ABC-2 type transport system ATP-binding protein